MALQIEFSRRASVNQTDITKRRSYTSTDGRYRVVEVRWLSGAAYGRYWLAIRRGYLGECVISRHKKRHAAEAACMADRKGSIRE